jgi:hypothetical protein
MTELLNTNIFIPTTLHCQTLKPEIPHFSLRN